MNDQKILSEALKHTSAVSRLLAKVNALSGSNGPLVKEGARALHEMLLKEAVQMQSCASGVLRGDGSTDHVELS